MLTTIIVAFVTALSTGLITFAIQKRRLRADLRTEFIAEEAVKQLLSSPQWKMRSFDEIERKIGGFEENELRKLLVRAGLFDLGTKTIVSSGGSGREIRTRWNKR